jgi:hypothetical protein
MNGGMKYGDVALGVEAALPAFRPDQRPGYGYAHLVQSCSVQTSIGRALIWLYAALKRWA